VFIEQKNSIVGMELNVSGVVGRDILTEQIPKPGGASSTAPGEDVESVFVSFTHIRSLRE
jgi:hypothetical protein